MKQKLFTLFLALVASVGAIYASDTKVDGIWYDFNESNKTATVTYRGSGYNSYNNEYSGSVIIPSSITYNGTSYSVTSIGEHAFYDCSSLTSVTIGNSVTSIGIGAFAGCSSLTSVTIGNSVTSIGWGAFSGCSKLTSVNIPNSVTSIGLEAFYGCSSLTSVHTTDLAAWCNIDFEGYSANPLSSAHNLYLNGELVKDLVIPNSVTSIGERTFQGCSSLTSVTIPNSVTIIRDMAFSYCSSLTSITIPNSVTSIGDMAFSYCSSLTSITIPNSVTSIRSSAFEGCSNITSVTWNAKNCNSCNFGSQVASFEFGNEVEVIPSSLCQGMTKLTAITIPNSVTSIGNRAFDNCSSLTSVTINSDAIVNKAYTSSDNLSNIFGSQVTEYIIGDNVKGIGNNAFRGCSSLTSITIPNSVTSIGEYAFSGCSSLTSVTIPNSVTSIESSVFYDCSSLTSVTIPNSVTSIGYRAFYGCSSLTSITIPNSVTSIGYYAFCNCSSLRSINVDSNNPNYSSVDGVLFNKDKTTLGAYPGGKQGAYTIPNSVTSIGEYAFSGCSSLTSVTIGNSVTSIGGYAFGECESLKTVVLGSSVKVLEAAAFAYCSSIETITCYSMRPPTVNQDALYGLDYSTIVYVPADYLNTYKMHDAWGLYDVRPLGATSAETENVKITPSENEANVTWPSVDNAASYELVIKDKNGNIVCTLIFNANGQLTSIAFNAPSRNGVPAQTQNAGFSFTITGLDSGTGYDLTLTAKDNSGNTIVETTIPFHTDYPEGIENVPSSSLQGGDRGRLILRDGQVFILRNGKTYTMQGQEVK